jgi:hypothetical protein
MALTDAQIRNLTRPGKYTDGAGLFLALTPAGGKLWRMKYRFGGKENVLSFGAYPGVSLKAVRDLAALARKALQHGTDPSELRKAAKVKTAHELNNTLEVVARDWMQHQGKRWEQKTSDRIMASLANDIFKSLGSRPLASIKPGEIMHLVKKIEARCSPAMAT